MPAPIGNSNALKWTVEVTQELLTKMESWIDDPSVIYLGQLLTKYKTTNKQWRRIKEMYACTDEIIDRIELIEEALIHRLTVAGINGTYKGTIIQLVLKSKGVFIDPEKEERKKAEAAIEEDEKIDDTVIKAIEKELGPLSATFAYSKDSRKILSIVAGKTKNEMRDMGYFYEKGAVIGPRPYIIVSDDFSFPL